MVAIDGPGPQILHWAEVVGHEELIGKHIPESVQLQM